MLGAFSSVLARSAEDAARLESLGATNVEYLGDLKLAAPKLPADPAVLAEMTARLAGRPIFLAASTHPGEEILIKAAHDSLMARHPRLLTIVTPRHPERGAELSEILRAPRRDAGPPEAGGLWIADSLGELGIWYRLSDAVFIGRSLVPPGGGQNPLEPARLGNAIASGRYTSNFTEHVARLKAADALAIVEDPAQLADFVDKMLSDVEARCRMGERAQAATAAPETLPGEVARRFLALAGGRG